MRFKGNDDDIYSSDISRMRGDLNALGMDASPEEIRKAWEAFSEDMAAGWMIYKTADSLETLISYLEPVE